MRQNTWSTIGSWVMLASFVLMAASGCRGEQASMKSGPPRGLAAAGEGASSKETASQEAEAKGSAVGNSPAADTPKGVGNPCVVAADCPGYLSCVQESCTVPGAVLDKPDEDTPAVTIELDAGKDARFFSELAITPGEHEKGLMFRRSLPDHWSMLFIYPEDGQRSFWMQNTFIPLDMLFISAAGEVVSIEHEAEPLTRTPRRSAGPARYVLEIRGGLARELGIQAGQKVQFEHVPAEHGL